MKTAGRHCIVHSAVGSPFRSTLATCRSSPIPSSKARHGNGRRLGRTSRRGGDPGPDGKCRIGSGSPDRVRSGRWLCRSSPISSSRGPPRSCRCGYRIGAWMKGGLDFSFSFGRRTQSSSSVKTYFVWPLRWDDEDGGKRTNSRINMAIASAKGRLATSFAVLVCGAAIAPLRTAHVVCATSNAGAAVVALRQLVSWLGQRGHKAD